MARSRYVVSLTALMAFIAGPNLVQSLDMEYCASINTAQTPTNSSIYQSDGLCHDFCNKQLFAFAIVQAFDCWCSDYIPADSTQVDTSKCNRVCPGWPDDTCGARGLYGYMLLDSQPSGTRSVGTTPTSSHTSSSPTSSSSSSSSTPTTTVHTVTVGGTVSIVTLLPTPTDDPGSSKPDDNSSKGINPGAIAGIVIGVLAAVIIAAVAIFLILRKRRQREEELGSRPGSHIGGSGGMMSTPTTAMASVWDGENTSSGRRSSRLMPHDPRMDPFATNMYSRFENKSRESVNTLQDNHDYSRKVLRTTNPDPEDD